MDLVKLLNRTSSTTNTQQTVAYVLAKLGNAEAIAAVAVYAQEQIRRLEVESGDEGNLLEMKKAENGGLCQLERICLPVNVLSVSFKILQ